MIAFSFFFSKKNIRKFLVKKSISHKGPYRFKHLIIRSHVMSKTIIMNSITSSSVNEHTKRHRRLIKVLRNNADFDN